MCICVVFAIETFKEIFKERVKSQQKNWKSGFFFENSNFESWSKYIEFFLILLVRRNLVSAAAFLIWNYFYFFGRILEDFTRE
jgi:hypothetical protein